MRAHPELFRDFAVQVAGYLCNEGGMRWKTFTVQWALSLPRLC